MVSAQTFMEGDKVIFKDSECENIIKLQNINQVYENGNVVIKDFDLLIEDKPNQGQFVVILGRSGCGKSTILRYICGLQKPTSGEVSIFNKPFVQNENSISMVFQQYSSFPWLTVLDNVAFPLKLSGKKSAKEINETAMYWINKVGLSGHEKKFAQYPLLSGGQLQRVAIARSLATDAKILLLDEPFGALDIQTRIQMQVLMHQLWSELQNLTIVMVTHDIAEAVFLADDIFVMSANPGKIVKHFFIDLPYNQRQELRKTKEFTKFTSEIENFMLSLS